MSPTNHSDNSWQEVRRGKNKDREPSRTASGGRNLPNIQNVSRVAASGRSLSKAQPVLQTAPSGRAQPNAILHQTTTPKRKEAIPYEIKNAREWDPNRRPQDHSSESSDEDEDYDLDYDEWPEVSGHITSNATSSGAQLVSNQRPKVNAHPRGQPPFHPKVHAPHGRPTPGPRPAHPRARFNFKKDNLAKTAFRRRLEPSGRFMLPRDCPDIEPNQKRMYDTFEEIGVRLGSFIRPPQHVKDRELLLWGDARQVQNTKGELNRWLDKCLQRGLPRKPMGKDNFSKETSVVGDQHHRLIRKMHKEAKILEFQQAPADGQVFLYAGAFIWPVDEVRPEDILGPSLEAFDPVRYQYHCHIIFDHRLSIFRIFSDREDAINKTIDRIVGTMREYVAKSVRPDMLILIEPPIPSVVRKDVSVRRLSADDSKAGQSMIPVLTGSTLDAECQREWIEKSDELMRKNNHRMELSLRKCVATLPHHRGLVRIRVQFGTFALKVFRWKDGAESTAFEEFIDNTSMAGTKGRMVREQVNIWIDFCTLLMSTSSLQIKKDATTIIAKVQKATHLFLPMDSSNTSLEAVVPSFSACFEFKNLDTPPMNFLLEMRSSPAAPTVYEEVQALWTRTDRRDNAVPLEIFMARLDRYVVPIFFPALLITSQWGVMETSSVYRKQYRP